MIDPADLQAFLNKIDGGSGAVDLLKIGNKHHQENANNSSGNSKNKNAGSLRIGVDIEDCLDRFYGGYYSDWACGGQWNRAYQFVQLLAHAFSNAHIEVFAFFDGTLKKNKKVAFERNDFRQKTISVLKHIRMIGTPPPKIWWLPPSGIRTVIRNALRSVNIQVVQTVNDHTMEVIEYFHEHKLDGILGLHPDYIIANISRYFSSHDLRLSYKGSLETKEFMSSKLLSSLSLTADHLPFLAVFLGGYIRIDETKLKSINEILKLDANMDFEARIRRLAEIIRNSPTTDIDAFIRHLKLEDFEADLKESVEYYQRRGKFAASKKLLGTRKQLKKAVVAATAVPVPFASETNENDEVAKKILSDVTNLVDDGAGGDNEVNATLSNEGSANSSTDSSEKEVPTSEANISTKTSTNTPFVYTLPIEILKTSLDRHQRGIMDSRLYQLLSKKEIILPQVLEDEQYREIPSVHLFYRPARQMIYAIIFNMYHQKYLCSNRKNDSNNDGSGSSNKKSSKKDKKAADKAEKQAEKSTDSNSNHNSNSSTNSQKPPEILVAEWIWSPKNEYKKPDMVPATSLVWAVPTVQRLWFGMALEDKQRRIRAFLSIMRSDSPLMLNRGYVPQHMLVLACVLRYIVTSPDRNILTRQELDAFLATAFSPQLQMVENTQKLVLPGVHLRGVYLATLFMQGVETCSLVNDACGVPLPWTMINPWIFFDGKLFHLKLKMSTYVSTLRELCDDHIEIVLKIERFRKAILEDVEHFLLPAAHIDPRYRPGFLQHPPLPLAAFNKNAAAVAAATALHPLASAGNPALFYNPQAYFPLTSALLGRDALAGVNTAINNNGNFNGRNNRNQRGNNGQNKKGGYQLKVGGIVTGSWAAQNNFAAAAAAAAASVASHSLCGPTGNRMGGNRLNGNFAAARIGLNNRGKRGGSQNNNSGMLMAGGRFARMYGGGNGTNGNATSANNKSTNKRNRNRNKRNNKNNKKKSDNSANENTGNENENNEDITAATLENSEDKTFLTAESETSIEKLAISTAAIESVSEKIKEITLCDNENSVALNKTENLATVSTHTVDLQNGNAAVLGSDLANEICNRILNDDDCYIASATTSPSPPHNYVSTIQQQQPSLHPPPPQQQHPPTAN